MRFKQYLAEGTRSEVISEDEAIDILQKNCKNTVRSYLNDKSMELLKRSAE